jgi:DNA polymerase-3 subunit alpha
VSKGGKDLITRYFVEKFGYDRVVQVSNHEEWLCVFSDPSPEIQRTNDEISHALLCKSSDLPNNVLLNLYVHEDSAVSMFKNCIKMIHKRNDPNFNPEMIRDDDNRVLQVLTSDQNCDLLQYKSKLTQHLTVHNLKQFGARSFWDICCIIGASESYERITNWGLTRYAGARNPFEYVSKSLHTVPLGQQFLEFKSILDDTDGILLFEVQYVQIIQVYTGYSYGRAEMLRRTIGAGSVDRIKEEQTLFVKSSDQNGHKLERAEEAFKFLLYNYDNLCSKSEVVARSKFAYTCAYLKVQYPEQLKFIHDRSKLQ